MAQPEKMFETARKTILQWIIRSHWADQIAILSVVFLARVWSFSRSTINIDESFYMLIAREILAGRLPYVDIFVEKPLGAPLVMAAVMAIFGPAILPVRIMSTVAVAITACLLRKIALAIGLSRLSALIAAILFACASTRLGGLATNIEILFIPMTTAAVSIAVAHVECKDNPVQRRAIMLMGLFIGLSIWFKYVSGLMGCMIFVWLVSVWMWNGYLSLKQSIILALYYAFICALPTIFSGIFYYWQGEWGGFWYSNFGFMKYYQNVQYGWPVTTFFIVTSIFSISLVIFLTGMSLIHQAIQPRFAILMVLWLSTEIIAVISPLKFFDHYFLLLLPALSVLSGSVVDLIKRSKDIFFRKILIVAVTWMMAEIWFVLLDWKGLEFVALVLLIPMVIIFNGILTRVLRKIIRNPWWQGSPQRQARTAILTGLAVGVVLLWPALTIGTKPDTEREIANIIREDHGSGSSLWVVNYETVIYLLIESPIPTPYVFPHFLTGLFGAVAQIDTNAEVARILATRPTYLVVNPIQWQWAPPATKMLIQQAIANHYQLLATRPFGRYEIELYKAKADAGAAQPGITQ